MGLPHVVVRFYTNPDGRAARRTTVGVLAMLSVFYLLPTVYGVLGRIYAPDLIVTGDTDSVVLTLPDRMLGGSAADPDHRPPRSRRLRGVPVHLVGARRLGQRRAEPGRPEPALRSGDRVPGRRRARGRGHAAALARHAGTARSRTRSSSPSPSRRRRSARCSCSASGGAGSPPAARSPAWWSAACCPGAAVLAVMVGVSPGGWWGALLAQPALLTVPIAFATMIGVSARRPRAGCRCTSAGPWCGCTCPRPSRSTEAATTR